MCAVPEPGFSGGFPSARQLQPPGWGALRESPRLLLAEPSSAAASAAQVFLPLFTGRGWSSGVAAPASIKGPELERLS